MGKKPPESTPVPRSVEGELVDETFEKSRQQMESLAWLFDEAIELPGIRWRIGLDSLVGLLPGVGDLCSAAASAYIIGAAARMGVSKIVLSRMVLNAAVDALLGSIPIVGDVFDAGFKANRRNVRLAMAHASYPKSAVRSSWLTFLLLFVVTLTLALAGMWVLWLSVHALWTRATAG